MKNVVRLSLAAALLLIVSTLVCGPAEAQARANAFATDSDFASATMPAPSVPAQFPPTDASLTAIVPFDDRSPSSLAIIEARDMAASSLFEISSASLEFAPSSPPTAIPSTPEPKPGPYYYENPNKWQLGVAFALVRFRSSLYDATAPGLNTSLAYWLKEWVGVEGSVTSAFAPAVFENEHFRYLGYGVGPKFSFGHGRLAPWAHALVGGAHLIPQTAASGKNGFEFSMGGGVDYMLSSVVSAKAGVDYLGTHMFGEWQSSVQIVAGFSFRF